MNNNKIMDMCSCGIGCCLLFFTIIINIDRLKVLTVTPDEFGYWSAGAWFRGYDWHSAVGLNSYYQFGYGLVLAILMFLFDGIYLYKAAVVVNALFLCITFLLLRKIGLIIYKKSRGVNTIIALMVSFYAANVAYAQTSTSEILLQLLYIMLLFLIVKAAENNFGVSYMMACFFLLLAMFSVHMRSLGIVMVAGMIMIRRLWLKSKRETIGLGILFLLGFLVMNVLKGLFMDEMYIASDRISINDYSGQVAKLKGMLSFSGIREVVITMAGHLWYLGTSSCLMVWIALWQGVKSLKEFVRGNRSRYVLYECFILVNFLSAYMVSVIVCKGGERIDTLIYGRYVEYTILPLLISAVYALIEKRIRCWEVSCIFFAYFICSLLINIIYLNSDYDSIVYTTITGICKFIYRNKKDFVYPSCIWMALVGCIGIAFIFCKRRTLMMISFSLFAYMWWLNGNAFIQNVCIKDWTDKVEVPLIYETLEKSEKLPIYYVYSSEDTLSVKNRIFLLQVMLEENSIKCIEYDEFVPKDNCYIVVNTLSQIASVVDFNYVKVEEGYPLALYKLSL